MTKQMKSEHDKNFPRGFRFVFILIMLTWLVLGIEVLINRASGQNIHDINIENIENSERIQTLIIKNEMLNNKIDLINKRIDQLSTEIDMVLNSYLPKSAPGDDKTKKSGGVSSLEQDNSSQEAQDTTQAAAGLSNNSEVEKYEKMAYEKDELSAGLNDVSDRTAALEEKLDKVNENLQKSNASNISNNLILSAVRLRDAVNNYKTFSGELDTFKSFAKDDDNLQQDIATLQKYARNGAPSIEELRIDFDSVANEISNYDRKQKPEPTFLDKVAVQFSSLVQVRKVEADAAGNNTDDILARAYNDLLKSDVEKAAEEVKQLTEGAKVIAAPWLEKAEANIQSKKASEEIFSYVTKVTASTNG